MTSFGGLSFNFGRSKSKGLNPFDLFRQFAGSNELLSNYGNLNSEVEREIARRQASPYLTGITGNLEGVQSRLEQFLDQGNFSGLLSRQAAASTDQATRAALLASRTAAGSRGGLGYGGGASVLANRAGALAGASTGEALLQALIGGEQLKLGALGQLGDVSSRLGAARATQEQLFQEQTAPRLQARQQFLNILASLAGTSISGPGGVPRSTQTNFGGTVSS